MVRHVLFLVGLLASQVVLGAPLRIATLAPHATEWVYALGAEKHLVAVSAHSDYPPEAAALPIVADYQGVNFEHLLRLQPTLVIVWQGGNKPQDIARLQTLNIDVFISSPKTPYDIADEMVALGQSLGVPERANDIAASLRASLDALKARYRPLPRLRVFYYMWPKPLMTIGDGAWASGLLSLCGANNVFSDSLVDYPEVTLEQVLAKQPQRIVAAQHGDANQLAVQWQPWQSTLQAPFIQVDPDRLHRFTPRLISGLHDLCERLRVP
ncbi:cobalamin-binding protein [Aestuariibacter halophilus]|uniref:Cobalamin-binding protein n=1 Tax=Fluctibacter halophilus TaxID=226011 RepID=A0ABS8GA70_9ALTE|nr:cobalamin-binding protein [Aestuariibacter halophilus]MCC2617435.1 cobalamin-binding protein [Aestuariibacter halophilus]